MRKFLGPFRGEPAVDRAALIEVLLALSQLALDNAHVVSVDVNPLIVVEGIPTAYALHDLSRKLDIDMPVTENVYEVLASGRSPAESVRALMGREPTQEHGAR